MNRLVVEAKQNHLKNMLFSCRSYIKKVGKRSESLWDVKLLRLKKKLFEGVSITESSDIADVFNKFFAFILQLPSQSSNVDATELRRNDNTFYLFHVGASNCEKNNFKPEKHQDRFKPCTCKIAKTCI